MLYFLEYKDSYCLRLSLLVFFYNIRKIVVEIVINVIGYRMIFSL